MCPALQSKPELPTPNLDVAGVERKDGKIVKTDPFAPPYTPNLFLGELKDQEENAEYVVLVSTTFGVSLCGCVMGWTDIVIV